MKNPITSIREHLRQRANMNATIEQLSKLTDDELKDIGILRGEINTIARSVISFHRHVRDNK